MKYKFEQFNIEFENPTIEINTDSLTVQPTKSTIGVDIVLTVNGAKFGINLTDIPVNTLEFLGENQLMERVLFKLQDFVIN